MLQVWVDKKRVRKESDLGNVSNDLGLVSVVAWNLTQVCLPIQEQCGGRNILDVLTVEASTTLPQTLQTIL